MERAEVLKACQAQEQTPQPFLVRGRTCWRVERSDRCGFLIDGEAYFKTFRDVALHAKHSIMIVGWDLDTQIELVRGPAEPSEFPSKLGEFVSALLRRKRKLRVHVLNWDFAMIYALEREWMPTAQTGWSGHRRLSYQVDGQHPIGASHHQKLVVIDDTIAFVGGLDLTKSRWDTPAHACQDPLRVDADGQPYAPFHDVQMMVSGEAAAALGELARDRWFNATGRRLPLAIQRPVEELWPVALVPDVEPCGVGIMRTQPAYAGQPEVREIELAYLEGIKRARRSIYIESQYFTSNAISRALAARLMEQDGPEVVLVLRHSCDGWLERQTMDALRSRILHELELADHYGRLRIYAPTVPGTQGRDMVAVHSKLLIVDEDFVCLGSANVSNRSMGFDTECNLAIESGGTSRLQAVIARLRNGLIGEHLGVEPELVAEHVQRLDSLGPAIDHLRGGDRSLEDGCFDKSPAEAISIPEQLLIDPERPMAADEVLGAVVQHRERAHVGRRVFLGYTVLLLLGLLAAAWRWSPLSEWMNVNDLVDAVRALGQGPTGSLVMLGGFLVGGFLAVPITVLIVVTILAFGPLVGAPSALAGALLSAVTIFGLGRALGRYRVQRFAGRRVAHLSRRIAQRGFWAILIVRLLPIAPFSMVNLVAGATSLSLRDFLLGTALGMSPGIVLMSAFVDRLAEALRNPSPVAFGVLGLLMAAAWSVAWYVSRRLQVRDTAPDVGNVQQVAPAA